MMIQSFVMALAFSAVASANSIIDVVKSNPSLSTFLELVNKYPDLVQALTTTPAITVFAPDNQAFSELLSDQPELRNQPDTLKAVLQYHVLPSSRVLAYSIPESGLFAHTLLTNPSFSLVTGGQVIKAQRTGRFVTITSGNHVESHVGTADVLFANGVLHTVSKVFHIPADIATTAAAAKLTSFTKALTDTNLLNKVNTLRDVTVFAPTDDAFAGLGKLPTGDELAKVLTYHVVQGNVVYSTTIKQGEQITTLNGASVIVTVGNSALFINRGRVVNTDVLVKNGVVHVINLVLTPPPGGKSPAENDD